MSGELRIGGFGDIRAAVSSSERQIRVTSHDATSRHSRPGPLTPSSSIGPEECPHRPTYIFYAYFVITHTHPESTSQSVTHAENALGQAHLTSKFFRDELPKNKLQLVGVSIPVNPIKL